MSDKSQPWDYFPLYPVYAFTNLKKARKFVKKITGIKYKPSGKNGSFTEYENEDLGDRFGVIYLDCDDVSTQSKYAVLAHECVHYAQSFSKTVSDDPLDDETFAYVVESAMMACVDQIGEEWFLGSST